MFSAQTRRFGHSHNFGSGKHRRKFGFWRIKLYAKGGASLREVAPRVSVTGIARKLSQIAPWIKNHFGCERGAAIIAREYPRSKTPRSQPRPQVSHNLTFELEPATACLKAFREDAQLEAGRYSQ